MKMFLIAFALTLIAFGAIDTVWLTLTKGPIYQPLMGSLLTPRINMTAAVVFYVAYAFGVTWFLTFPALSGQLPAYGLSPLLAPTASAAILGLVGYGTYNFTALAVIRDWPLKLVIIDTLWGMALTVAASHAAVAIGRFFR